MFVRTQSIRVKFLSRQVGHTLSLTTSELSLITVHGTRRARCSATTDTVVAAPKEASRESANGVRCGVSPITVPASDTTGLFAPFAPTLARPQGKYDEAERLSREAVAKLEAVLGCDHPALSRSLSSRATVLSLQVLYGGHPSGEGWMKQRAPPFTRARKTKHTARKVYLLLYIAPFPSANPDRESSRRLRTR